MRASEREKDAIRS
jgi:hypothetical protein